LFDVTNVPIKRNINDKLNLETGNFLEIRMFRLIACGKIWSDLRNLEMVKAG